MFQFISNWSEHRTQRWSSRSTVGPLALKRSNSRLCNRLFQQTFQLVQKKRKTELLAFSQLIYEAGYGKLKTTIVWNEIQYQLTFQPKIDILESIGSLQQYKTIHFHLFIVRDLRNAVITSIT